MPPDLDITITIVLLRGTCDLNNSISLPSGSVLSIKIGVSFVVAYAVVDVVADAGADANAVMGGAQV